MTSNIKMNLIKESEQTHSDPIVQKYFYSTGKIFAEIEMINGFYHGVYNLYYENGQLYFTCHHYEGKGVGTYVFYETDGTVKAKGDFSNNNVESLKADVSTTKGNVDARTSSV